MNEIMVSPLLRSTSQLQQYLPVVGATVAYSPQLFPFFMEVSLNHLPKAFVILRRDDPVATYEVSVKLYRANN